MRVCQPGPVAFQEAMTSGRSRRDNNFLGCANFGRPRRTTFRPRRRSASSIQDSVISGGSSLDEMRTESLRFALMTMPHADDPAGGPTRCPNEHHQSRIKPPCRDVTRLSVIETIIDSREMQPSEHFPGTAHVQAPHLQRLKPLGWVARDTHWLNVATFNHAVKRWYPVGVLANEWRTLFIAARARGLSRPTPSARRLPARCRAPA